MPNLIFYAHFTANKIGKTGLTPTIKIWQIDRTDLGWSEEVASGTMNALGKGIYFYGLANASAADVDHVAVASTTDTTVDAQDIPALWTKSEANIVRMLNAHATGLENFTAARALKLDSIDSILESSSAAANSSSAAANSSGSLESYFNGENYDVPDAMNSIGDVVSQVLRLSKNKVITDPITHTYKVYADDGVTVLLSGMLYEDPDGQIPYRGQGVSRREMLQ